MENWYASLQAVVSDEEGARTPSSWRVTERAPDSSEKKIMVVDLCLNPILLTSQPERRVDCCSFGMKGFSASQGD
jgi:hypothetical protein